MNRIHRMPSTLSLIPSIPFIPSSSCVLRFLRRCPIALGGKLPENHQELVQVTAWQGDAS